MPPDPPQWPPEDAVVHEIHDRYLLEVVEAMNLCPFSRKSREAGLVQRPIFREVPSREDVEVACELLVETVRATPLVEIMLLTCPIPAGHPWTDSKRFDQFMTSLRDTFSAREGLPTFYMVSFHPSPPRVAESVRSPHQLIPLIRRTPDPVIQCVRAETLDEVRRQAQLVHDARVRERVLEESPELVSLLDRCVTTDPEISSDIAEANFRAMSKERARAHLDETITDIQAERHRRYGDVRKSPAT